MRIRERLTRKEPTFSFEFYPPKTPEGEAALWKAFEGLQSLAPDFVSVTYGAGGSQQDRSVDLVSQIQRRTGIEAMAHLTCVGQSEASLSGLLSRFADAGVENILALRGDAPQQAVEPSAFRYASQLVTFIRASRLPFDVGAASYPEGHVECADRETDLRHLKTKVEQGCDFLITQLFFDNAYYFDFVTRARAAGITVPIIPGIMPVGNPEQLNRFVSMCGATVPHRLRRSIEELGSDLPAIAQLGIAHATAQCMELLARGAPGIHFYTLNKSRATRLIMAALRTNADA